MSNLEIQMNKSKITIICLILFFALILGIATVYYLYVIGVISITLILVFSVFLILFPYLLFLFIKILLSKEPALIINNKGIIDNINISKLGLVEWKNIKGLREVRIFFSNMLILDVINTEVLLKNLNKKQKKNAENNIKQFGTACVTNLSSLKYNKDELIKIISEYISKQIQ